MATNDVNQWLTAGVAALKNGEREQAQALLLRVVEADENQPVEPIEA